MLVYLDTSALAKWYLNEPGSETFAAWIRDQEDVHVSGLAALELRRLLIHRRQRGDLPGPLEREIYAAFRDDVERGHLIRHELRDVEIAGAIQLLESLERIPLRILDALHLAVAQGLGAGCLASADRKMAAAAETLGMKTFVPA